MSLNIPSTNINIEESWKEKLSFEFQQQYFLEIKKFLLEEKANGKTIYPNGSLIFNAFNLTPFADVKVVILGQDPYHGQGQAHGLSFSVPEGIKPPPSLTNIYKELKNDVDFQIPNHGNLTPWAQRGVLLLNSILTVRANEAASHQKIGWERFTDSVITNLSEYREGIVFLLWGKFAHQKSELIDKSKHHVLFAAHPSPFSAYNGFFGCKHFSRTNLLLSYQNILPINWQL
jgi:uracil-DNA glycosylase